MRRCAKPACAAWSASFCAGTRCSKPSARSWRSARSAICYGEVDYIHGIGRWYTGYEWISRKATGGSSLLTGGCHAVDGLRWFVQQDAVEVQAYANWSRGNPLGYEYEPNSVTLIRFAQGAMGKVGSSIECVMPYMFHILLLGNQGSIRNNQLYTARWPGQKDWATIPTILPDSGAVTHHPFEAEI